jgi:hypothetical protein
LIYVKYIGKVSLFDRLFIENYYGCCFKFEKVN